MRGRPIFFAPAAAALGVVAIGAAGWAFTIDDAFIVARYARNVVEHGTWGLNAGVASDGVTSIVWAVPMMAACALGIDPMIVAKALGLAMAGIGYLWILIDKKHRALHDLLTDTIVVRAGGGQVRAVAPDYLPTRRSPRMPRS